MVGLGWVGMVGLVGLVWQGWLGRVGMEWYSCSAEPPTSEYDGERCEKKSLQQS